MTGSAHLYVPTLAYPRTMGQMDPLLLDVKFDTLHGSIGKAERNMVYLYLC